MILEMLLGGSALILAILALRLVLGRRMGARLRYALWLLVLLRLLLPVHLGRSAVSPANLARVAERDGTVFSVPLSTVRPPASGVSIEPGGKLVNATSFGYPLANADGTVTRYGWKHTLPDVLPLVWKIGIAAAAAWYLLCNLLFYRGLRRTRTPLQTLGKLPVYVAKTPSPCLFGLFRPAIYVTAEAARNPDTLSHVLLHEETHFRHGDQLWALARTVCLTVWWFNPLVYLAAAASRRDCELFCDDAVIRRLGEERRAAYGRTLLALAAGKRRPTAASCAASTLSGGGKPLRQRIRAIAKWARPKKWAILAAAVLALLAGACAFSGAREGAGEPAEPSAPPVSAAEALERLHASIARREEAISFTVPEGFDGEWTIELQGRAVYDDGMSMSLHPLEGTEWTGGETYSVSLEGVTELYLNARLPGAEPLELDLLSESGEEPDYEAMFAVLSEDPDNDSLRQPLLDAGDGAVRYARDYLLSHPGCLDGLSWDDRSLPAVLYHFYMASLPPEADMGLAAETIGEYWDAYVELACRTYPAGSERPADETWLPIWELGQAAENPYRMSWIDDTLQTIDGAYLGMPLDEARALLGDNLIPDETRSGVQAFRFMGAYYNFLADEEGIYRLSELWADAENSGLPLCVKANIGWSLADVLSKYQVEAPPEDYTEIQYFGQKGQPCSATLTRVDYATKAALLELRGGTACVQIEFDDEGLVSSVFCGYSEQLELMNTVNWANDPAFATTEGVFLGMDYDTALGMAGTPETVYPEQNNTRSFRAGGVFYGFDRFSDGSYRLTGYAADGDAADVLPFGLRREQSRADVLRALGLDPSLKPDGGSIYPGPDGSQWFLTQDTRFGDGLVRLQGTSRSGNILTVTFGRDDRVWLISCDSLWASLPYTIGQLFRDDPDFADATLLETAVADDGAYGLLGAALYQPTKGDLAYGVAFCLRSGEDGRTWFHPVTFGPGQDGNFAEPVPETLRYLGDGRVGLTLRAASGIERETVVSYERDASGTTFRAVDAAPPEAEPASEPPHGGAVS